MMDCKDIREILDLYVDGELSPEATVQAETHLAECVPCRSAVARLNRLRQIVKTTVGQYQPMPQLVDRVRQSTISRWRRPRTWVPVAATVLLIAVMSLFAPQIRGAVANGLEVAAFHLDDSRATVMEGKLLCRDCLLKEEYGYHAMCPTRGHHGSLQTRDGKIWHILDGEASEELIHNSKLLGRTVRIHGRCFRRASSIEVDSYEVL
ncbi:MAG TPA: zf-HC2 domain-containing protein [Terriglobales bacterium]|nr:zf-HC2 domain-containing protein [Terriglobales bacterium]